jgi:dTDP-4-amino-4,6-dideoxygalactose transaminase
MKSIEIPYENLKAVNFPYSQMLINDSINTIENGWYILGEKVSKFEKAFSEIHNNNYFIGVASGLDALIIGLSVFDFKKGSKVLVPSNAYIASILAILRAGLIPVLVEPDPLTFNITASGLEKYYTDTCVAILPVHLYGRLCPMNEIIDFAKVKNLKIIEDCAQAHFSEIDGVKAGEFGDIGAFSFYPTKNLGALGDAGGILCKDFDLYKKILSLRNYGSFVKYYNQFIGWNSRLDEIQAGFLLTKINDYKKVITHKNELSKLYSSNLVQNINLQLPLSSNKDSVWHIYNILSHKRDELKLYLLNNGIGTEIHYPIAPHKQEAYKTYFKGKYPISDYIHSRTLSLPISTFHTKNDIQRVSEVINDFYKNG